MSGSNSDYTFYDYTPSLVAAAIFLAIFGISTLLHCYQSVRSRAWYMIPFILGGICETIGYIGRALNSHEAPNYGLAPYILQSLLILIAPALLSASIYMVLGHIITVVRGEDRCMIKKKFLTLTFVVGDLWSFMVQSTGAGLLAKTDPSSISAGKWIVVGGLAIQLIFFGLFIVVSINFYERIHKSPTQYSGSHEIHWRRTLYNLYAASVLIMVRSVFRVVEYAQGSNGYLLHREVWLYIFDALLMAVVMLLFNVVHPSVISTPGNAQTDMESKATNMGRQISSDGAIILPSPNSARGSDAV